MTSEDIAANSPVAINESETFYSNVSHVLHAAAQALTVLQLCHNTERLRRMDKDELIGLASSSSQEIERLCTLMGYMQQFVAIQRCSPRLAKIEISSLITDVSDGLELLFQDAGIFLVTRMPDPCDAVFINAAKASQALSGVLLVAFGIADRNDTVELTVSCLPNEVEIEVRAISLRSAPMDADMSLRIGMAEANIRSQGGRFSYSLEPFCAKVRFQKILPAQQPSRQVRTKSI